MVRRSLRSKSPQQQEQQRADLERQARLNAVGRLQSLNLTPEQIAEVLGLPIEEVRSIIARL
jgi:predicted transposase YdaD